MVTSNTRPDGSRGMQMKTDLAQWSAVKVGKVYCVTDHRLLNTFNTVSDLRCWCHGSGPRALTPDHHIVRQPTTEIPISRSSQLPRFLSVEAMLSLCGSFAVIIAADAKLRFYTNVPLNVFFVGERVAEATSRASSCKRGGESERSQGES